MIVSVSLPVLQPPLCGWCGCFLPAFTMYTHRRAGWIHRDERDAKPRGRRPELALMATRRSKRIRKSGIEVQSSEREFSDERVERSSVANRKMSHMNIHPESCGKEAEVSGFIVHSGFFLANMKYRGFAPSDLPRPYMIIEDVAAGQRPSGSSAPGKIIATSRQMYQLKKKKGQR